MKPALYFSGSSSIRSILERIVFVLGSLSNLASLRHAPQPEVRSSPFSTPWVLTLPNLYCQVSLLAVLETICLKIWVEQLPKSAKVYVQLMSVAQKRLSWSHLLFHGSRTRYCQRNNASQVQKANKVQRHDNSDVRDISSTTEVVFRVLIFLFWLVFCDIRWWIAHAD